MLANVYDQVVTKVMLRRSGIFLVFEVITRVLLRRYECFLAF